MICKSLDKPFSIINTYQSDMCIKIEARINERLWQIFSEHFILIQLRNCPCSHIPINHLTLWPVSWRLVESIDASQFLVLKYCEAIESALCNLKVLANSCNLIILYRCLLKFSQLLITVCKQNKCTAECWCLICSTEPYSKICWSKVHSYFK